MTDEQINRAIAEACGWTEIQSDFDPIGGNSFLHGTQPDGKMRCVQNYANDLNAMHEAERHIPANLGWAYAAELSELVEFENRLSVFWLEQQPECATARQRAEAFLRTLGKWEEGQ